MQDAFLAAMVERLIAAVRVRVTQPKFVDEDIDHPDKSSSTMVVEQLRI
jgi:hypothetical protein